MPTCTAKLKSSHCNCQNCRNMARLVELNKSYRALIIRLPPQKQAIADKVRELDRAIAEGQQRRDNVNRFACELADIDHPGEISAQDDLATMDKVLSDLKELRQNLAAQL